MSLINASNAKAVAEVGISSINQGISDISFASRYLSKEPEIDAEIKKIMALRDALILLIKQSTTKDE